MASIQCLYVTHKEAKVLCSIENYACLIFLMTGICQLLLLCDTTYLSSVKSVKYLKSPSSGFCSLLLYHTASREPPCREGSAPYRTNHKNATTHGTRTNGHSTSEQQIMPSFGMWALERFLALSVWKNLQNLLYYWSSEMSIVFAKSNIFKEK